MVNNTETNKLKKWLPLIIALFTAFGMLVGYRMSNEKNNLKSTFVKKFDNDAGKTGRIEELLRLIEARYVENIDENVLLDAATRAIIDELDPHSVYISPEELSRVNESMSGYYNGLGIETILLRDTLRITKIVKNSPAEEFGLKYGDKILKVRDSLIAGQKMKIERQWELLKTTSNEKIDISVSGIDDKIRDTHIISNTIKFPNVTSFLLEDIAYIDINKFSEETYEGIVKALESFQKDKVIDKLVIDLRNNPGGYLPEATKILNQLFVEDKRLLVFTQDGNERKNEYKTTGRPFYRVNKLAILINDNSASASEIIAGALQDWDKAVIIGEQSFGKGLVQEQYELSNGGAIRLTIARYFTPSGRYIQTPFKNDNFSDTIPYVSKVFNRPLVARGGISPDKEIKWTAEEKELIELLDEEKISLAYEFVMNHKLYQNPNFDIIRYADQLEAVIVNYFKKYEKNPNEIQLVMLSEILKEEIYTQLGNEVKALESFASYDIYFKEAKYIMSKEDIFAEFKTN